jgi:hypothetical protein
MHVNRSSRVLERRSEVFSRFGRFEATISAISNTCQIAYFNINIERSDLLLSTSFAYMAFSEVDNVFNMAVEIQGKCEHRSVA